MKTEHIGLTPLVPGQPLSLIKHTFGQRGQARSAYLQAGLHADEHPGILVLQHLMEMLSEHEKQGRIQGEIVVVPFANPVGLLQIVLGYWTGRFNLANGENFNRYFPDIRHALDKLPLTEDAAPAEMLRNVLADSMPADTAGQMKHSLLAEALKHDLVLDLHCDMDAVLHLYTNQVHTDRARRLASALGAEVVFVEEYAGGQPFDESVYHAWKWFADKALLPRENIPFSVTVELRGQTDVSDELARRDAQCILKFLAAEGLVTLDEPVMLNVQNATAYPLEGASQLRAPDNGILAWRKKPGDRVTQGECIAELVHPDREPASARTPVYSDVNGVMVARPVMKMVRAGQRIALLAGVEKLHSRQAGSLLGHF